MLYFIKNKHWLVFKVYVEKIYIFEDLSDVKRCWCCYKLFWNRCLFDLIPYPNNIHLLHQSCPFRYSLKKPVSSCKVSQGKIIILRLICLFHPQIMYLGLRWSKSVFLSIYSAKRAKCTKRHWHYINSFFINTNYIRRFFSNYADITCVIMTDRSNCELTLGYRN